MSGTKTEPIDPYCTAAKPEDPFTDAEMKLWDSLAVACLIRPDGVSTTEKIANFADCMVKERRKRHGVR